MEHSLPHTVALLSRTPAALNSLLRDLPEEWIRPNEGENTWSAIDIVGHLIYAEQADWMPRVKSILEFGESRAFDPFDRLGHVPLVQGKSLSQLLDEFSAARSRSLAGLHALDLQPGQLLLRGLHPALGPVTLAQLLATWASHDLTHLHQLSRVLAHQYRRAVGPWTAYLGVFQCAAHSAP